MKKEDHKNLEKARELRGHLNRQFKDLKPSDPVPEDLKDEVFSALDTMQLMADITDLFTVKFASSEMRLLDLFDDDKNEHNHRAEDV